MTLNKNLKLDEDEILELIKSLPEERQKSIIVKIDQDQEAAVIVDLLCGNEMCKKIDQTMHTCGMFEDGKILATYEEIIVKGKPKLDALCDNLKAAWEEQGGYVIFAGIRSINGIKNTEHPPYFKTNIQSLSMLRNHNLKWALFKDFLESLGYSVETDQYMNVTKVS